MKRSLKVLFIILLAAVSLWSQNQQTPLDLQQRQIKRMASEFERNGQTEQAADIYYMLSMENPLDISSYAGAKRTMLKLQQFDRFKSLVLELQKERRDLRYQVDLAEVEFLTGNTRDAKKRWDEILDNNAMTHSSYALVGQALTAHGLVDDAVDCYLKGRKKLKDDRLFIFELSSLYVHRAEYDKATKEYIAYIETNPKQFHFIDTRFANMEKNDDSYKDIVNTLEHALKEKPKLGLELHQILGNVYSRNTQYEKALEQFIAMEDTLQNRNDSRIGLYLYQFATLTAKDSVLDISQTAFETLLKDYPKSEYSHRARLGFALILEQKGMFREAIQSYEAFAKQFPKAPEAQDALEKSGDIYFNRLNDHNQARKIYKQFEKKYPRSPRIVDIYFKLAECEILSNDLNSAKGFYRHIIQKQKSKKDIYYKKALYAMANANFMGGYPKESAEFLKEYFDNKIRDNQPDLYENDALELNMLLQENSMDSTGLVIFGKASLLYHQNKLDQSDSLLSDYIKNTPDTPLLDAINWFRAQIYIEKQMYDDAIVLLQQMYENEDNLYRDKALYNMAGLYQTKLDQKEKAKELYESLLVNFPSSIYIEDTRKKVRNL